MKHRIARILGEHFLPVAADPQEAADKIHKESELIALLRADVETYNEARDRGRLGRSLVQRADTYLLCNNADAAVADLDETAALFHQDQRDDALLLVDARLAWAMILQGDAPTAVQTLQEIVSREDLTVRAWADQLWLWLAGGYMALQDTAAARHALEQARAIVDDEPKRDGTLIHAALSRLSAA